MMMDAADYIGVFILGFFPVVMIVQCALCISSAHHYTDNQTLRTFMNLLFGFEAFVWALLLVAVIWHMIAQMLNERELDQE